MGGVIPPRIIDCVNPPRLTLANRLRMEINNLKHKRFIEKLNIFQQNYTKNATKINFSDNQIPAV